jgi:hypothetical protein
VINFDSPARGLERQHQWLGCPGGGVIESTDFSPQPFSCHRIQLRNSWRRSTMEINPSRVIGIQFPKVATL